MIALNRLLMGPLLALAFGATLGDQPASAQPAPVQRIAAVVNQDMISVQQLGERVDLALLAASLPDDAPNRQRIAPLVLRSMIDERLQLQEAKRLGIGLAAAEIDQAFVDIARRNQMAPEQLEQMLRSRRIEPAVLRRQIEAEIAWARVIGREARSRAVVTREQVDMALRAARSGQEEILISEILLPVDDPAREAATVREAADLARSIQGGRGFDGLARQISRSPSAEAGGDLGWVSTASIAPEFRQVFARMAPGAVSDPVRTPAGVHLFWLRDRRTVTPTAEADVSEADRDRVRQTLERAQVERFATRRLRELRRAAFIDLRL